MGITIAITMGIDDDRDYDRDDDWLRNKWLLVAENDAPHQSPAFFGQAEVTQKSYRPSVWSACPQCYSVAGGRCFAPLWKRVA